MARSIPYRRHHQARVIARAERVLRDSWGFPNRFVTEEEIHLYATKMANNMKLCSGACCCNPRRSGWLKGLYACTIQERRHLQEPLTY